jgi:hypothetical protein
VRLIAELNANYGMVEIRLYRSYFAASRDWMRNSKTLFPEVNVFHYELVYTALRRLIINPKVSSGVYWALQHGSSFKHSSNEFARWHHGTGNAPRDRGHAALVLYASQQPRLLLEESNFTGDTGGFAGSPNEAKTRKTNAMPGCTPLLMQSCIQCMHRI